MTFIGRATRPMARVAMVSFACFIPMNAAVSQSSGQEAGSPAASVDTSVLFTPGAQEILRDSPNVFFSSRFQIGRVGSWSYRLFPDGSALVLPDRDNSAADYSIDCPTRASCVISGSDGSTETVTANSPSPEEPGTTDGRALAQTLAYWIMTGKYPPAQPVFVPSAPTSPAPAALSSEPLSGQGLSTGAAKPALASQPSIPTVAGAVLEAPVRSVPTEPEEVEVEVAQLTPAEAEIVNEELQQDWTPEPTAVVIPVLTNRKAPTPTAEPKATNEPKARETLAEKFRLSCSVSAVFGLQFNDYKDGSKEFGKQTASFGCGARLTERLSLRLSVIAYRVQDQKAPWDPNFTYALSYRFTDWLTLGYSSYSAQFSDPGGNLLNAFSSGSFQLSAKLPNLPLGETRNLACSSFVSVPQDYDHRFGLSCGIRATEKLTVRGTIYAYPKSGQEPWDPDYVYTAAYALTDDIRIEYANYANNRWPWNGSTSTEPGPLGGTFRVSYRLKF